MVVARISKNVQKYNQCLNLTIDIERMQEYKINMKKGNTKWYIWFSQIQSIILR